MTSGSGYEGANYAVEFDEMERTTSLTCEVRGPVSKRDSSFYEVICEFLSQDVPYAAWGDPIGHCHGHVWWTITK